MVIVAQLVRASDCGSEGRGFETRLSPLNLKSPEVIQGFFVFICFAQGIEASYHVARIARRLPKQPMCHDNYN